MSEEENKGEQKEAKKEHHCSICGKPSELTICHACEDKIRGEAVEQKHDVEHKK